MSRMFSSHEKIISGIQQIGIGVTDAQEAWKWYREQFGMDIKVFEDENPAELMLPYTDGKPRDKYAVLAFNMEGGGGFEIWQHLGIDPRHPHVNVLLGDLGLHTAKIKCRDIRRAYSAHIERGLNVLGPLDKDPAGVPTYFIADPYGNIFQVVEERVFFRKEKSLTGGVYGSIIGVSDIDEARKVYSDILNYEEVVYDETGKFHDLSFLPGGDHTFRRVLLNHKNARLGAFSKLLGPSRIELVQVLDREPQKIYQDRLWGELGYIHLCFDITGMNKLKKECDEKGFPFTVDSANTFDMGVSSGRFSYIEDLDGTLIEFVETHRLPIVKWLGLHMKLKGRRKFFKPLPKWMVLSLIFGREKD